MIIPTGRYADEPTPLCMDGAGTPDLKSREMLLCGMYMLAA
jgi:hypothetical protein